MKTRTLPESQNEKKEDEMNEFNSAVKYFTSTSSYVRLEAIRQAIHYESSEEESSSSEEETAKEKPLSTEELFTFIKNMNLVDERIHSYIDVGKAKFKHDFFSQVRAHLPIFIEKFTPEQRYELAKIHMERRGVEVLELYQLSDEQKKELKELAKVSIQSRLPQDDLVKNLIENNNPKGLKTYFFNCLSGPLDFDKEDIECRKKLYFELKNMVEDNLGFSEPFWTAYHQLKIQQEKSLLAKGWFLYPSPPNPKKSPTYWNEEKIQRNEMVPFSHGGGFFFLLKLLTGQIDGYHLKNGGHGIQVSPGLENVHYRDEEYGERSIGNGKYFDYPASISGKIRAKYLVDFPNLYEAGLKTKNLKHMEEIVITLFEDGSRFTIGKMSDVASVPALKEYLDLLKNPHTMVVSSPEHQTTLTGGSSAVILNKLPPVQIHTEETKAAITTQTKDNAARESSNVKVSYHFTPKEKESTPSTKTEKNAENNNAAVVSKKV